MDTSGLTLVSAFTCQATATCWVMRPLSSHVNVLNGCIHSQLQIDLLCFYLHAIHCYDIISHVTFTRNSSCIISHVVHVRSKAEAKSTPMLVHVTP